MRRIILLSSIIIGSLAAADLPVREVVLYKNGIGLFQRSGELKAGESARLDFKAEEMNDVLKSLTIVDASGAKVTGLRYDSSEPLERKLSVFPFRLGDQQPLSALLDQLKSAHVELKTGPETVAGVILSGREISNGEKQAPLEQVTLLTSSGELRAIDLAGVTGVRFSDPVLQLQLKDYLANLAAGRSQEKRSVYIDSGDASSRRITATYVVPTPVWKSSYRLVFTEKGEPLLEGWAIVDNTSGEDWTKVRLALVSGRPVSFISNLYEPRYLRRETIELPEDRAAQPELYAGAMSGEAGGGVAGAAQAPSARPSPATEAVEVTSAAPLLQTENTSPGMVMESRKISLPFATRNYDQLTLLTPGAVTSTVTAANAGQLAELFEYSFSSPVTVHKDQSAMLPFLQQAVKARKLLIYKEGASEEEMHPRNAAEITNSTGKTLDGGPITVYDANAYAGEALVETVKAGDKRLISYAVDLGARVATETDRSDGVVREIHLRRGILTARTTLQETVKYTIRNVDQKAKTLIIEHPIREGYKLLDQKPAETTASAYRFEVALRPDSTGKFEVAEERVLFNTVALTNTTPDILMTYVQNKQLDAAARKQLEQIANKKSEIAATDGEIRRVDEETNELTQDEQRTRQNIFSLNQVSGQQELVQNYARQLSEQEAKLMSLRGRAGELRKKKAALEAELSALIEKMEF